MVVQRTCDGGERDVQLFCDVLDRYFLHVFYPAGKIRRNIFGRIFFCVLAGSAIFMPTLALRDVERMWDDGAVGGSVLGHWKQLCGLIF